MIKEGGLIRASPFLFILLHGSLPPVEETVKHETPMHINMPMSAYMPLPMNAFVHCLCLCARSPTRAEKLKD